MDDSDPSQKQFLQERQAPLSPQANIQQKRVDLNPSSIAIKKLPPPTGKKRGRKPKALNGTIPKTEYEPNQSQPLLMDFQNSGEQLELSMDQKKQLQMKMGRRKSPSPIVPLGPPPSPPPQHNILHEAMKRVLKQASLLQPAEPDHELPVSSLGPSPPIPRETIEKGLRKYQQEQSEALAQSQNQEQGFEERKNQAGPLQGTVPVRQPERFTICPSGMAILGSDNRIGKSLLSNLDAIRDNFNTAIANFSEQLPRAEETLAWLERRAQEEEEAKQLEEEGQLSSLDMKRLEDALEQGFDQLEQKLDHLIEAKMAQVSKVVRSPSFFAMSPISENKDQAATPIFQNLKSPAHSNQSGLQERTSSKPWTGQSGRKSSVLSQKSGQSVRRAKTLLEMGREAGKSEKSSSSKMSGQSQNRRQKFAQPKKAKGQASASRGRDRVSRRKQLSQSAEEEDLDSTSSEKSDDLSRDEKKWEKIRSILKPIPEQIPPVEEPAKKSLDQFVDEKVDDKARFQAMMDHFEKEVEAGRPPESSSRVVTISSSQFLEAQNRENSEQPTDFGFTKSTNENGPSKKTDPRPSAPKESPKRFQRAEDKASRGPSRLSSKPSSVVRNGSRKPSRPERHRDLAENSQK